MDKKLESAEKEALVDIVKNLQKQRKRGSKGAWKEFLALHDNRKLGSGVSDPAKRSIDDLLTFLKTFTEEADFKLFEKILLCHSNRKALAEVDNNSTDPESSPQKLVKLTLEHPEYPLNYSFPSYNEDWVVTKMGKISKLKDSSAMLAIDCEMVLCEDDTEALVQVCVVDRNLEVKLNELVKPDKPVKDFRTHITGISAKDLEGVTNSLKDVQKSMKKLLSHGTILIGHSLNNDLQAMKLDHARIIDTAFVFKYLDEPSRRPSLNQLCKTVLGHEVREDGAPHNCLADARAAMKLVLAKENGFSGPIHSDKKEKDGSTNDLVKLLLHGIPINVGREELQKIFAKDSTVEIESKQPTFRSKGKYYTALAIFKDPQEANDAFESLEGEEGKDTFGRRQKKISLHTEPSTSLFVRKMATDDPLDQCPKKRSIEVTEIDEQSKKLKTDSNQCVTLIKEMPNTNSSLCQDHITEIANLKKQLKVRDDELINLQRIISSLVRKHGL